jgi:prepilin-type N-terminal cleavage/methylation domain-containing protein
MHRGFTLIELVIVMMIIGVLAGMGAPKLPPMLDRLAVARAVNRTTAFYNTGRLSAVWRGKRVRMELGTDSLIGVFEGRSDSTFLVVNGPAADGVVLTVSRPVVWIQANGLGLGAANTKLVFRRGNAADSLATSRLGRLRRMSGGRAVAR